jgi:hypothetical protein
MKKEIEVYLHEFSQYFADREEISKSELRLFYTAKNPLMTIQEFRRHLYALEKMEVLTPFGRGQYAFLKKKRKWQPHPSPFLEEICNSISIQFPYIEYQIWETSELNEFMVHQPIRNHIILESEKMSLDALFSFLIEKFPGRVYLEPDRAMIERYAYQQPVSVFVCKWISQAPRDRRYPGIPYAKLEKILVDLFVDRDRYFIFQDGELETIYKYIFSNYLLDKKSMFRYAGRRNASVKLKEFIQNR